MTVAHHLACQLLSHGKTEDELERICTQAEKLIHPDLLVLDELWIDTICDDWDHIARTSNVPQVHRSKTPKAKTDTISIDDVRSIRDLLYETSTGGYRCCIIRSIERMQDAAVSVLLKLIEEPPPGVVFIFTTQARSGILPTIVSRCRIVHFQRVPYRHLAPMLSDLDNDDVQFILRIAAGAPGTVQRLVDDPDVLREHRQYHQQACLFWNESSTLKRLRILEPLYKRGRDSDTFLFHLALSLREQTSATIVSNTPALNILQQDLQTNAHRQLMTQRFVSSL